jgi:hypothetical protein
MTCTIKAKKTFLDKMKQQRNVCVINNQYIPHYFITTLPNHYEDGWRSIAHVVHNSDVLYSKHYWPRADKFNDSYKSTEIWRFVD